jgi:uncharacterized membrane protein YkvA (DUF1232 family)
MSEIDSKCLETFPEWLRALSTDAQDLAGAVGNADAPDAVRRYAAAGLNYLFKSLDLIPDGIEDLGYLDDAFVLRVAASLAVAEAADAAQKAPEVARLAKDTEIISELLGDDYARLENYVKSLKDGAARGRTVEDIVTDETVQRDFLNEVGGWATSYEAPSFGKDEKNLVKLKSFLSAKLPE